MTAVTNGLVITTSFYKENEYFDVCEINGSKFALFSRQFQIDENLSINLSDHNIVFLAPIEVEKNISINAISVIALSTLNAKKGETQIRASEKFILLGGTINSFKGNKIIAQKDVLYSGIIKERLKMILEEFNKGISNKDGKTIVDALVETFAAVDDPSGEKEDIDYAQAYKFFNISLDI